MYYPDRWVMVKIAPKEYNEYYRVFGTWLGGYARGDEWRLNSGVTKIEEDGQLYRFHGSSGSVYQCHKATYGMSAYTMGILSNFQKQVDETEGVTLELLPDTTNFMELHYE